MSLTAPPRTVSPGPWILDEEVFRAVERRVERALWRRGVPRQHRADLMQEVWLTVLSRPEFWGLAADGRERYAVRVAFGIFANTARGNTRRLRRELAVADCALQAVSAVDLTLDKKEAVASVLLALRALGDELFGVVVDHYLRERSLAEIAQGAGVPMGTVKSRLLRARGELRRAIRRLERVQTTAQRLAELDRRRAGR
jgi:RNA polymerase sigma factor (sigma-70 family)